MIGLMTEQTVDFTLSVHAKLEEATRPVFRARYMTARQWMQCDELVRKAAQQQDNQAGLDALVQAIGMTVVGWQVADEAFTACDMARLPDLLTFAELWEVMYGALEAQMPGADERKKSASPSPSSTG